MQDIHFSDPYREESSKSRIPIKDFNTFIHSYREEDDGLLGYRLCYSCVYHSETLWLLQNLPLGIYCLHCSSFLWKPRNWYRNCFISRSSPDMDLTRCLLLQHTYHLYFNFLPTTHVALHYAFLTTDTDLYHFIFNVYTGTLEMEFLTFKIKSLTDFIA